MVNKIIDGVCEKLGENFEGVKIYTEEVRQGLQEPCFFVQCVNSARTQIVGRRYSQSNLFCVTYIPKSEENANAECLSVLPVLYDALEYITADGALLRGTKKNGETRDSILTFFVNYDCILIETYEPETMEKFNYEINLKG